MNMRPGAAVMAHPRRRMAVGCHRPRAQRGTSCCAAVDGEGIGHQESTAQNKVILESVQKEVGGRLAPLFIRLLHCLSHHALPRVLALALVVQRASKIAANTVHILLRIAQSDRVKRMKGRGQRPHRVIVPSRFEKRGVQVEVGRKAGFPFKSVAPRLIRLLRCLAHLALPRSLALVVQRASRIATNTVHILPRVAR